MPEKPVDIIEVFFDDFIGATNNSDLTNLLHLSLCMLHGIHAIYPPSEVTQHGGSDLVSEKKLIKGDGTWAHEKEILGWIFNDQDYTLRLPAEKNRKILERLQNIKRFTTKTPGKVMEKLAGSLQNASFGIQEGAGLFSTIQVALKGTSQ